MGFEPVFSVWDYYDGPRSGAALYKGQPHAFRNDCWDEEANEYSGIYHLIPLTPEILALALEREQIWRAWERSFFRGEVAEATHPGNPGQDPRYSQLDALLKDFVSGRSTCDAFSARASFRAKPGQAFKPRGMLAELEVDWTDIGNGRDAGESD
jgi:hypothetical protein